jgi:hypothetical protein
MPVCHAVLAHARVSSGLEFLHTLHKHHQLQVFEAYLVSYVVLPASMLKSLYDFVPLLCCYVRNIACEWEGCVGMLVSLAMLARAVTRSVSAGHGLLYTLHKPHHVCAAKYPLKCYARGMSK